MSIALFGGTFDPIHKGHLAVAQAALEDRRFGIERIYFVPADIPPHKQKQAITPYRDRHVMVELAISGYQNFTASRIEDPEQTQGTPNYSINTVRRFKREHNLSANDLYFIVGIDSFLGFSSWREPEALLQECRFIVASRPGFGKETIGAALLTSCAHENVNLLETVAVDISATQIREAVARREPLDKYVVPAVARYIEEHQLYR